MKRYLGSCSRCKLFKTLPHVDPPQHARKVYAKPYHIFVGLLPVSPRALRAHRVRRSNDSRVDVR